MQITIRPKLMPVCPASFPDRLSGILSGLNPHIGYQTGFLPNGKIIPNNKFYLLLARIILWENSTIKCFWPTPAERLLAYPLYAVEALTEDIICTRGEVVLLPKTQSIAQSSIGISIVAPDCLDINARAFGVHGVNQSTILHGALLSHRHLRVVYPAMDLDRVALRYRVWH
jgi:hypothetical protein